MIYERVPIELSYRQAYDVGYDVYAHLNDKRVARAEISVCSDGGSRVPVPWNRWVVAPRGASRAYVGNVRVCDDFQKRGIGTALMRYVVLVAVLDLKADVVTLTSEVHAIRVYKRAGFIATDPTPDEYPRWTHMIHVSGLAAANLWPPFIRE
jgi:GNAT superfamily N-acetyltransferase